MPLFDKVDQAIARIISVSTCHKGLYIGHSGGKDSATILHLVDTALPGHNLPILHTPKFGETHPKTIEYLYRLGRPLLYLPKEARSPFGEDVFRVQVDGTRIDEHDRTDGRSTDFVDEGVSRPRTELRAFVERGLFGRSFLYPIFDWTTEEVWEYLNTNNLKVSEEYDEDRDRS